MELQKTNEKKTAAEVLNGKVSTVEMDEDKQLDC